MPQKAMDNMSLLQHTGAQKPNLTHIISWFFPCALVFFRDISMFTALTPRDQTPASKTLPNHKTKVLDKHALYNNSKKKTIPTKKLLTHNGFNNGPKDLTSIGCFQK